MPQRPLTRTQFRLQTWQILTAGKHQFLWINHESYSGVMSVEGLQWTDDDAFTFGLEWNGEKAKWVYKDASLVVGELVSFCWCIQCSFIHMIHSLWWELRHEWFSISFPDIDGTLQWQSRGNLCCSSWIYKERINSHYHFCQVCNSALFGNIWFSESKIGSLFEREIHFFKLLSETFSRTKGLF